jgi:hypothetical protein
MASSPARPLIPPALTRRLVAAACAALLAPSSMPSTAATTSMDAAPADPDARTHEMAARTRLGFERVKLPGGEGMGLTGLSELLSIGGDWWAGGGVYGATTGHRGGLFVPGVEVAWMPTIAKRLKLDTGVFAGGGGGGNAPVGGGLMLRPHADLLWQGDGWSTGPTVSWVRFGNQGRIDSKQVGWVLDFNSDFRFRGAGPIRVGEPTDPRGAIARGLAFERIDATLTRYQPRKGSVRVDNGAALSGIDLVGIRAEHPFGDMEWAGIEAAGAASGGVAGYAEVLGTVGLRWPVAGGRVVLGVRGALGTGGGGGVDTGGGALYKAAGGATVRLTDTLGLTTEIGIVRAPQGRFNANTVDLALNWQLDPQPGAWRDGTRMEWVAGVERYDAARKVGGPHPLEAGALAINRFVTENVYLTGQAHSAFGGGAGAYSVGLFGVGAQVPVVPRLRLGAEVLAGAAGGGGVDTRGGAIVQARAYMDVPLDRTLSLRVGAGKVRAVHGGGLDAPAIDAALVFRFGVDRPH